MPRDVHAHECGLAGAGRHLAGNPVKARLRLGIGIFDLLAEALGCNFGQVDQHLRRLALAEKQPPCARGVAPVLEQALRLGADAPLARGKSAPLVHVLPDFVDEGIWGDLRPILIVQGQFGPTWATTAGSRHGDDLNALPPARQFDAGRLTLAIKPVVAGRHAERRIDDRVVGKPHEAPSLSRYDWNHLSGCRT
jgi:hypothetical protein